MIAKFLILLCLNLAVANCFSQSSKEGVFAPVDEPAQFPGGMSKLYDFMRRNLTWPVEVEKIDVDGKIFVGFVVEIDGSLSAVEIVKSINKPVDDEALRLVKGMPNWIPGKNRGIAVRSKYVLPIRFCRFE
jgi:protein TonB